MTSQIPNVNPPKSAKSRSLFVGALASVLALNAASASATAFDITLDFGDGLTQSQKDVFTAVELSFESLITGYEFELERFSGPTISASGADIDDSASSGDILGQAGVLTFREEQGVDVSSYAYTTRGFMVFDDENLLSLEQNGDLFDVVWHEMAHVLGFGTLWDVVDAYDTGTGQYTGAYGLAGYISECDANASYVPVELDFGEGTADSHWDEGWACGPNAIMTGLYDGESFISEATIGSFQDLGYTVSSLIPVPIPVVPLPAGGALMASGLALFGAFGRRKKRKA